MPKHTSEPRLDLGQKIQGGFAAAGPHLVYTGAIKIEGLPNPGQRGRQKSGVPPEAELNHMDGDLGVAKP